MRATSGSDNYPPLAEYEAITCPVERLAALTKLADERRHRFPPAYAACRRAAALEAREKRDAAGQRLSLRVLAERVGVSFARVWQLTRAAQESAPFRRACDGTPRRLGATDLTVPEGGNR